MAAKDRRARVVLKESLEDVFGDEIPAALAGLLREFRREYVSMEISTYSGGNCVTSMIVPISLLPALYSTLQADRFCKNVRVSAYPIGESADALVPATTVAEEVA
jgi:hypothetical protein